MHAVVPTAPVSDGKSTTGGTNGQKEQIKRISAELDDAVKRERIARSSREKRRRAFVVVL
jgi:hypothetical protein